MSSRSEFERPSRVHKRTDAYITVTAGLARTVRKIRLAKGWTLEHAAEQMSLDLKHLQKIEAATVNVTLVTLTRIASGLGVEVGDLFEATPERVEPSARHAREPTPNPVEHPPSEDRLRMIGRRLGEVRRAKRWTQAELARRVGEDAGRIQRIENGRVASFPISLLLEAADVLGVDASDLLKPGEVRSVRVGRPAKPR